VVCLIMRVINFVFDSFIVFDLLEI
jgi:hypothetical protein